MIFFSKSTRFAQSREKLWIPIGIWEGTALPGVCQKLSQKTQNWKQLLTQLHWGDRAQIVPKLRQDMAPVPKPIAVINYPLEGA